MPNRTWLRRTLAALSVLAALSLAPAAGAQEAPPSWQPLETPGGPISHLAAAPGGMTLYAVATAGVHRRDDQTQWRTGVPARSNAIYRSDDAGLSWQAITNDLPPAEITALYVDPADERLYAALAGWDEASAAQDGLWASTDRGARWQRLPLPGAGLWIRSIARTADGGQLLVAAVTRGPNPESYLYRLSAGQSAWEDSRVLDDDAALRELVVHPVDPQRLFLVTTRGELSVSRDGGSTWSPAALAEPGSDSGSSQSVRLVFAPDRPSLGLAASDGPAGLRLYRSTDGGLSWSRVRASGLPERGAPAALAALPAGVYLLNLGAGTYRSTDRGATWQPLEGVLSSGEVAAFAVLSPLRGSASPAVLAATGFGLAVSRDAGAVWQTVGSGLPFNSKIVGLATHPASHNTTWLIADARPLWGAPAPPVILRSTDDGRRWTPAAAGLYGVELSSWTPDPADPSALWATSAGQAFLTTDGGLSWEALNPPARSVAAVAIAASDPARIYLAGLPVLTSSDRGRTWSEAPVLAGGGAQQAEPATGIVVDPTDPSRAWVSLASAGVFETRDHGRTWRPAGLEGKPVEWLTGGATTDQEGRWQPLTGLYAGVSEDGIYRRSTTSAAWEPASEGLPAGSTIIVFAADPRVPGLLWAGRDGGGLYRSSDGGGRWSNVGAGMGDNLVQSIAIDYNAPGGVLLGTATAGVWSLRSGVAPAASPTADPSSAPRPPSGQAGVDARIEILWPHDGGAVGQARLANIGLRLFEPASLRPPACGWQPKVTVWQAVNTEPAAPLGEAEQRTVDGRPFPYWNLNDLDISRANDPSQRLYYLVRVEGVDTATSIWAHGADLRTYFPQQDVPSGILAGPIEAVDARIQVVWPHDEAGNLRPVAEATLANVSVAFFGHGTRLSVPVSWRPQGLTLYGAWDQEVGRPLSQEATGQARRAGAITYPIWEFNNIPVARAASQPGGGTEHSSTLYLWVMVTGVETYPTIWAHGADARTFFPAQDEPIQGCTP